MITRASLGRSAYLGDLYDARSDSFCSDSVFNEKLPLELIQRQDNDFCDLRHSVSDSLSEKFDKLKVDGELSLSVLGGLLQVSGHANYLSDNKQSQKCVRASLIYNINTKVERVNFANPKLRPYFDLISIDNDTATHVVSEIYWGANSTVTFEHKVNDVTEIQEASGELNVFLNKFRISVNARAGLDYQDGAIDKSKTFNVKIHADVVPHVQLPRTIDDALTFMTNLPTYMEKVNEGKGKPLTYILTPLSVVRSKLDPALRRIEICIRSLNDDIISDYINFFQEVNVMQQKLEDLYLELSNNEQCVTFEQLERVSTFRETVRQRERTLKSKLGELLTKVRSGQLEVVSLTQNLNEHKLNKLNLGEMRTFIDSHLDVNNKIETVSVLKSEGVVYLGRSCSLERELFKHTVKDIYILFISDEFKRNNMELFQETVGLFRNLLGKHRKDDPELINSHFVVVDLDLCDNIHNRGKFSQRISIVRYKDNKFISQDVKEEMELERNRNLIRCTEVQFVPHKPIKLTQLIVCCPGFRNRYGDCSSEKRKWQCSRCHEFVEYDFNESVFCTCGKSNVDLCEFQCCDTKHGYNFFTFDDENCFKSELKLIKTQVDKILNVMVCSTSKLNCVNFVNNLLKSLLQNDSLSNFIDSDDNSEQVEVYTSKQGSVLFKFILLPLTNLTDYSGIDKQCLTQLTDIFTNEITELDAICIDLNGTINDETHLLNYIENIFKITPQQLSTNLFFCLDKDINNNMFSVASLNKVLKQLKVDKISINNEENYFVMNDEGCREVYEFILRVYCVHSREITCVIKNLSAVIDHVFNTLSVVNELMTGFYILNDMMLSYLLPTHPPYQILIQNYFEIFLAFKYEIVENDDVINPSLNCCNIVDTMTKITCIQQSIACLLSKLADVAEKHQHKLLYSTVENKLRQNIDLIELSGVIYSDSVIISNDYIICKCLNHCNLFYDAPIGVIYEDFDDLKNAFESFIINLNCSFLVFT